jgi:hypothetical protein
MKYLLNQIEHYKKFPAMIPFIGKQYLDSCHQKLLLIGESNYFPKASEIHKDAEAWYKAKQDDLSTEEIEWLHCVNLLNCSWSSPGHFLYRELNSSLNSLGLCADTRAIENVAYMNAFQRPAFDTGNSFKNCCTKIDSTIAINTIVSVVNVIKPELIIFVSKYAWDICGEKVKSQCENIDVNFVCHPATGGRYWHKAGYAHGKPKFLKLLSEKFLVTASA